MDQWSTLADDAKRHISQRGPQCGVLTMLEKLPDPAARETVERVLADRGLTNPAIAKALRDRLGEDSPSVFTVGNHRRGNCSCAERRS